MVDFKKLILKRGRREKGMNEETGRCDKYKQCPCLKEGFPSFPFCENPSWSENLRGLANEFWLRWIGANIVGYDSAIQDLGELIDYALMENNSSLSKVINNE